MGFAENPVRDIGGCPELVAYRPGVGEVLGLGG